MNCCSRFGYLNSSYSRGSSNVNVSELYSYSIAFRWQNSMTDVSVTLLPPCWCPSDGDQHGYIQSSINLDEILFRITREWITAQILILTRLFRYQSFFISQLLDVIQWKVMILIFDGVTLQTSHYDIKMTTTCYWAFVWVQYCDLVKTCRVYLSKY